jgi:uncharacterized HAD superfamily protein
MSVKSKTIYVDLDDVLCQTASYFLAIVEREFGKRIAYEDLIHFDMGESCGLRSEEREELYRIAHEPDELAQIAPIAEAINTVTEWIQQGYEIAIVTGRPPDSYEPTVSWMMQHRVPHHSFTMVDKYGRFATHDTIAISLEELASRSYCWAVEDSLPMAQYLADQMRVRVALIDRPWNRTDFAHPRVNRCRDWGGIAQALSALMARPAGS